MLTFVIVVSEPRQFTRDELRERLSRVHWQRSDPPGSPTDWPKLIRKMVGKNSFRALHPSTLFREWALEALVGEGRFYEKLLPVRDQTAYDKWLDDFTNDFRDYWQRETGRRIPFAASRKPPDLLMKGVCNVLPEANYRLVVWCLHVPLDSYSIQAVRNCIGTEIGRTIPQNPTMGFVKDRHIYDSLQKAIRRVAEDANVPPITLDILAWDEPHKNRPMTRAQKVIAQEILNQVQQHITTAGRGDRVFTSNLRRYIYKDIKADDASG